MHSFDYVVKWPSHVLLPLVERCWRHSAFGLFVSACVHNRTLQVH